MSAAAPAAAAASTVRPEYTLPPPRGCRRRRGTQTVGTGLGGVGVGGLCGVDAYAYYHAAEHTEGSLHDIGVSDGEGIERAGKKPVTGAGLSVDVGVIFMLQDCR